ncbi:protein phosphatase 2C domain-containing protein [Microlunatus panaciterrae]|nr:PP2C family serine/threonine-protein phosphatase [Microlunatus panaciterrae]
MVRAVNEDGILAVPPVFVVADGIGGARGGATASSLVVEQFAILAQREPIRPDDVRHALEEAHAHVRALHQQSLPGAGTTACGAVAVELDREPHWFVFNIGDSRIYRTEGEDRSLVQLSVDHSHVQELVDAGAITAAQAAVHPGRNLVTRAVGSEEQFDPDFWLLPMVPGERLLICSDGLLREVPLATVQDVVRRAESAQAVVDHLLDLSLRAGARDNVSVIMVEVGRERAAEDGSGR